MNSTKTLKEIAYEVGFNNPDYFSTAFRRITGVSPMEFRKEG
ncbi:MAG: AraC family transcriptional regulator [Bacteroidaceae bacterium]|nr:AraC family transcriptional regulator [Bacteroidaceae bacterium]